MARIFKRGDVYYCWVPRPEGGTRKVSTNCTDPTAAHARAAQLERLAADPERAAAAKATLRDALELLIRDRTSAAKAKGSKRKKSMETVAFYQKKSGVLVDGIAAVLRRSPRAVVYLREVTPTLVDDYILQRREDGVMDSTIGKELTTWRAAMRLAKRRSLWFGDIEAVFPKGFGGDYEPGSRFLTPDEVLKLYRAMVRPTAYRKHGLTPEQVTVLRARVAAGENRKALAMEYSIAGGTLRKIVGEHSYEGEVRGQEYFAIVAYAIATGAEPAALWRAKRTDPAPDRSTCRVWGSKNKYREARDVPLPLLAFRFLLDYAVTHADGDAFLFPAQHQSSFRRTLAAACDRAGIARVSLTDLRRTHGKWLRLSGVAPSAIAPSLGHADGRMAERVYGQATAAELAPVVAAQIAAAGGGLLMGGARGETDDSGVALGDAPSAIPAESSCPDPESNQGHGDFQSFSKPQERSAKAVDLASRWEANGQSPPPPRTAAEEVEDPRGDTDDPREARPGPARAAPRHGPLSRAEERLVTTQRAVGALAVEWDVLEEAARRLEDDGGEP